MQLWKNRTRRIVALACALALLAAMLPAPALANEEPLPETLATVQQGTDEQQGSGDVVTGTESKQAAPEGEGENGNTPEDPSASSSQESGTPQPGDEEKAPENGGGQTQQDPPGEAADGSLPDTDRSGNPIELSQAADAVISMAPSITMCSSPPSYEGGTTSMPGCGRFSAGSAPAP